MTDAHRVTKRPDQLWVDAAGYVWRGPFDYNGVKGRVHPDGMGYDGLMSMAPTNYENSSIPMPLTEYVPRDADVTTEVWEECIPAKYYKVRDAHEPRRIMHVYDETPGLHRVIYERLVPVTPPYVEPVLKPGDVVAPLDPTDTRRWRYEPHTSLYPFISHLRSRWTRSDLPDQIRVGRVVFDEEQ